MIISHEYKFIFLKTNKTAGTSIEIALSKYCGSDDIITPITWEDEKIRRNLGYRGPQNYLAPISDYQIRDLARLLVKRKRKKKFYNHISAKKVRARIGEQVWSSYYKFCFERNPWERVISQYFWCYRLKRRPTILEFVESNTLLDLKRKGIKLYTIDGQIAVDKVCRYENIDEEMETIRVQLDMPEKLELPRVKSRFRNDRRSYRDILGPKQQERIAELFSDEISLFGYEF